MQAQASQENVQKMVDFTSRATELWLEFARSEDAAVHDQSLAKDLRQHDEALYGFARRDPDNSVRLA